MIFEKRIKKMIFKMFGYTEFVDAVRDREECRLKIEKKCDCEIKDINKEILKKNKIADIYLRYKTLDLLIDMYCGCILLKNKIK